MKTPPQLIPDPAGRITKEHFAYWWEIFADRWPNMAPKLPALISLYLDKAREELTAGRFDRAALAAVCESPFFPTPRALIDYGYGDIEGEAADAWAEIMRRNAGGYDVLTEEGTRARRMLARQGGSAAVKGATDYGAEQMRKRFLRDWVADVRAEMTREAQEAAQRALPPGEREPQALPALLEEIMVNLIGDPLHTRKGDPDTVTVPAVGPARPKRRATDTAAD